MKTTHKLLYQVTPFLVLSLYATSIAIYTLITDGSGWGGVAAIAILFLALVLFVVDYILKRVFKKYHETLIWELVIAAIVLIGYYYGLN